MSGESDDSDDSDDSHDDLSDDYSEAEEVIRNRLSQSVVEEPAAAQDARLVLLVLKCRYVLGVVLHTSF